MGKSHSLATAGGQAMTTADHELLTTILICIMVIVVTRLICIMIDSEDD